MTMMAGEVTMRDLAYQYITCAPEPMYIHTLPARLTDIPFRYQPQKSPPPSPSDATTTSTGDDIKVWYRHGSDTDDQSQSSVDSPFVVLYSQNSPWPRPYYDNHEDDTDSGYHTGNSTLQGGSGGGLPTRPKGEYTLTREELRRNIELFNNNNHGLIMSIEQDSNTFEGFIRVHMNLIRPINMSLSARPPSIYEVLTHEEPEQENQDTATQIASFYLPKDTTKVIHIKSHTSTQEVIKLLLTKFRITDNPRKFALYEKVQNEGQKAVMRKICDDELPLPMCLSWITEDGGLDTHKFVLQENDAGEILWDAFSIPELENFVRMLDKEEQEYLEQVKAKFQLMKIHMTRRRTQLEKERAKKQAEDKEKKSGEDKREPVFV